MFQHIWRKLVELWRRIKQLFIKTPPPSRRQTPPPSFEECERKFMQLLDGVAEGWNRAKIQAFLVKANITIDDWENWLQEFRQRILESPQLNAELARRLVLLGDANCWKVSEISGKLGQELLERQNQRGKPLGDSPPTLTNPPKVEETKINPQAIGLFNQGRECYLVGDLEGAITLWKKVVQIDSNHANGWYNLGICYGNLGRYEEAINAYNQVLKIDPENENASYNLRICYRHLGHYTDRDKPNLQEKESTNPPNLQEKEINPQAIELFNQGCDCYLAGNLEGAITLWKKVVQIDSNHANAWYNLGVSLYKLGRDEKAIEAYEKALDIDPNLANAWYNLGVSLYKLGRYEEAIEADEKALEITGDQHWQSWANRGWAFFNLGRYQEAIQNWEEGLQKYLPSNPDYRLACGQLHTQKGRAHYQYGKQTMTYWEFFNKAEASYLEACKFLTDPPIPEVYLEVLQDLIIVCRSLGHSAEVYSYLTLATTSLEQLLLDPKTDPFNQRKLRRKFAGFYQLEVDQLVEDGKKQEALEKAEERKNFCLKWMKEDSQKTLISPPYTKILNLLNPQTVILYFHLSPVAITAFILKQNQPLETVILADDRSLSDVGLSSNFGKFQNFERWMKKWRENYQDYCQQQTKNSSTQGVNKESHPWRQEMMTQLEELAQILEIPLILKTLLKNLNPTPTQLILIPHRDLHLLPLELLFQSPFCGATITHQISSITRLPSAQIGLDQPHQNNISNPSESLVIVKHLQGKTRLKFPEIETSVLSQIYPSHRFCQPNKEQIINALTTPYHLFHFTGHAYHNPNEPGNSALILGEGEELTLSEILNIKNRLFSSHLVCLSACETGITSQDGITDEFVGLASGFLPKTRYVISSLWRVDERSSALLMIYFYQLCRQNIHPPLALQQAKNWLRNLTNSDLAKWYQNTLLPLLKQNHCEDTVAFYIENEAERLQKNLATIGETPYEHPYHWAAFTITGNG